MREVPSSKKSSGNVLFDFLSYKLVWQTCNFNKLSPKKVPEKYHVLIRPGKNPCIFYHNFYTWSWNLFYKKVPETSLFRFCVKIKCSKKESVESYLILFVKIFESSVVKISTKNKKGLFRSVFYENYEKKIKWNFVGTFLNMNWIWIKNPLLNIFFKVSLVERFWDPNGILLGHFYYSGSLILNLVKFN